MTKNTLLRCEVCLLYRIEELKDRLENFKGFGKGVKEMYEEELEDTEKALKEIKQNL